MAEPSSVSNQASHGDDYGISATPPFRNCLQSARRAFCTDSRCHRGEVSMDEGRGEAVELLQLESPSRRVSVSVIVR